MTNEFILEGLCCSSCATKIEGAVSRLEGVESVTINLATTKLKIEATAGLAKNMFEIVKGIAHTYAPDIRVIKKGESSGIALERTDKKRMAWLNVGGAAFHFSTIFRLFWSFYALNHPHFR